MINVDTVFAELVKDVKTVTKAFSDASRKKVTKFLIDEVADPQSTIGVGLKAVKGIDKAIGYAGYALAAIQVSSFIADIQYAAQQSVNEAARGEKVTIKSFFNHAHEADRLIPEFSSDRPDRTRMLEMSKRQKEDTTNGKKELQREKTLQEEGKTINLQGTHFYSAVQKTKRVSPVR